MKRKSLLVRNLMVLACAGVLTLALGGCPPTKPGDGSTPGKPAAETPKVTPPANVAKAAAIRVKAGTDLKDAKGLTWVGDAGFEGGQVEDRSDGQITITGAGEYDPKLYTVEHYSMDSWSTKLPNGNYTLKLHFSEDYSGIQDENGRIFTFAVKDGPAATGKTIKEEKGFSPWKKSGAQYKAYVYTLDVTVTTGQLSILFTPETENPQINAIEVLPK